jgi:uncharacterized protein
VLTWTASHKQVRADVVPRRQGDMAIFAINHRTVKSANGLSRAAMRHGVGTIRRRSRMTLGTMRHDPRR